MAINKKCGHISSNEINKSVSINGWVRNNRKLGSLIFLDIADITGIAQVVIDNKNSNFSLCQTLPKESVVNIKGKVIKRSNPNNLIKTGLYEILLETITIHSIAEPLPILIKDGIDTLEDIKLKYRYLELRIPSVQNKIILRSKIINSFRTFLTSNEFNEIETPILSKQTPEGARDYLVPTRSKKFYALPQSPQIYKQLLMIAGFDKYFQIAKCFRDEDLRLDRQPEFTQLDMELSFLTENEIMEIVENMFKYVFKQIFNIDLKIPFVKMDYDVAMLKYGTDKPDIRYDYEIYDVSYHFLETNFQIFSNALKSKKVIKAIFIHNDILNKQNIKFLEKFATDNGSKGLSYITYSSSLIQGSIASNVEKEIMNSIFNQYKFSKGTILFIADDEKIATKSLGAIRSQLSKVIDIKFKNDFSFLWIINWPLFEINSNGKITSSHHPFTMPKIDSLNELNINPINTKAQAYDLVLNGFELGGGSIRIHDLELQKTIFKILGLSKKEIDSKFSFLLNAFKFGVPPHGGIAFGMDRFMMILTNSSSIRDVIPFPKMSDGFDIMLSSPIDVDNDALKELGLYSEK